MVAFWGAAISAIGGILGEKKKEERQQDLIEARQGDPWETSGGSTFLIVVTSGIILLIVGIVLIRYLK